LNQKNKPTLYRHYKNKLYKYLGSVQHSENLEDMVLYHPITENSQVELWVRPKKMFFENVLVNGQNQARFEVVDFKYLSLKNPNDKIKTDLLLLAQSIFVNMDLNILDTNLADKKNIIWLAAFDDDKIIGFKLGYEKSWRY
jgi:hypothetical protein